MLDRLPRARAARRHRLAWRLRDLPRARGEAPRPFAAVRPIRVRVGPVRRAFFDALFGRGADPPGQDGAVVDLELHLEHGDPSLEPAGHQLIGILLGRDPVDVGRHRSAAPSAREVALGIGVVVREEALLDDRRPQRLEAPAEGVRPRDARQQSDFLAGETIRRDRVAAAEGHQGSGRDRSGTVDRNSGPTILARPRRSRHAAADSALVRRRSAARPPRAAPTAARAADRRGRPDRFRVRPRRRHTRDRSRAQARDVGNHRRGRARRRRTPTPLGAPRRGDPVRRERVRRARAPQGRATPRPCARPVRARADCRNDGDGIAGPPSIAPARQDDAEAHLVQAPATAAAAGSSQRRRAPGSPDAHDRARGDRVGTLPGRDRAMQPRAPRPDERRRERGQRPGRPRSPGRPLRQPSPRACRRAPPRSSALSLRCCRDALRVPPDRSRPGGEPLRGRRTRPRARSQARRHSAPFPSIAELRGSRRSCARSRPRSGRAPGSRRARARPGCARQRARASPRRRRSKPSRRAPAVRPSYRGRAPRRGRDAVPRARCVESRRRRALTAETLPRSARPASARGRARIRARLLGRGHRPQECDLFALVRAAPITTGQSARVRIRSIDNAGLSFGGSSLRSPVTATRASGTPSSTKRSASSSVRAPTGSTRSRVGRIRRRTFR